MANRLLAYASALATASKEMWGVPQRDRDIQKRNGMTEKAYARRKNRLKMAKKSRRKNR